MSAGTGARAARGGPPPGAQGGRAGAGALAEGAPGGRRLASRLARRQREIAPGVYRLGSPWVSWFLVEEEGSLTAVDAGLPGFSRGLEADLAALGFRAADVAALVLTHPDPDHTGVARELQAAGAAVWIHEADEIALRERRPKGGDAEPARLLGRLWNPRVWLFLGYMQALGFGRPPRVEQARTFAGGELLDVPGRPRALHTPGHTPGHCVFHFERLRALFVGDQLCTWNPFSGRLGPQVMPSTFNGDTGECLRSLAVLEGLDAETILPGHGEPYREGAAAAAAQARLAGRS